MTREYEDEVKGVKMIIPVVEIFGPTLQGEGAMIGVQTLFVRLAACDYDCPMCDTRYAIEPAQYRSIVKRMTPEELLAAILEKIGTTKWVTFSGGNPALWDLRKVIKGLNKHNIYVAVETQGSIWKPWLALVDVLTISPKGPGMGVGAEKSKVDVAQFLTNHFACRELKSLCGIIHKIVLKIPIFDSPDLDFAEYFAEMYCRFEGSVEKGFPSVPLYLSVGNPMIDRTKNSAPYSTWDLRENGMRKLVAICDEVYKRPLLRDATILPQLHVMMFGNTREV